MTLEITLAGDVTIGDSTTTVPARTLAGSRDRVALALLTLERRHGVSRDSLAEALWPEGLPSTWASALRNVVSRVRSFVSESVPPSDDPIVTTEGGRYHLHLPDDAQVDVERAESAIASARRALDSEQAHEARQLAEDAAACLRAPFLADQDGEWAVTHRERYSELYVTALELASQAALEAGDPAGALAAATEAMAHSPLRESTYRCAMAAHRVAGNRAEALRLYQQLRSQLADELGVDPAPETETAYVDLLGSVAPAVAPTTEDRAARPARQAGFVGRARELALLADAWEVTTSTRRGRVVLVAGEAGIGKTRLVTEAARQVAAEGGLVVFGHCDSESGIAYQPLAELLENLLAVLPADELPVLDAMAQRELATVFPCFGEVAQPQPTTNRARLCAAVADLLVRTAVRRPMLAVLDDLQWLEADTLVVLLDLVRLVHEAPLMTVAIVRDPPTPSELFHGAVHSVDREGHLERIELSGLVEADVHELVAERHPQGGTGATARVARRLWSETSGNPFMILDVLEELAEDGSLLQGAGVVPNGISDLVEARLRPLHATGRDLLRAAAVTGRTFELDIVASTAGLDELDALDGLDAALSTGLVHEIGPGRYRFSHDIVQRTLYEQLSSSRRRYLHARCAEAIEALRIDDLRTHAAALARHSSAGAAPDGDHRAVRWARAAATHALSRCAPSEAHHLYRQALRHVPAGDVALHAEVSVELGLTLAELDDPEAGRTLLDAAVLARTTGRHDVALQAALGLSDLTRRRPELEAETLALMADLLTDADAGGGPTPETAVDHARLVARYTNLRGPDTPLDPAVTADAVAALAGALGDLAEIESLQQRRDLADELASLATVGGHGPGRLVAAHHRAMVAALEGDDATTTAVLDPDLVLVGGAAAEPLLDERTVTTAVTRGDFDEARAVATPWCPPADRNGRGRSDRGGAEHPVESLGVPDPGTMICRQLLVADWLQGRLGQHAGPDGPEPTRAEQVLIDLAHGERGRAHLAIRALASGADALPTGDTRLHDLGLLALAAVELCDPSTAGTVHGLLSPYAGLTCGVGYRSFVGTVRFHLGRLAAITGDWGDAERQLVAALAELTTRQARPWVALTQVALADVLDRRGRSSDRDWIAALRSEAQWSASRLGLAIAGPSDGAG